ncbi:MAG: CubicO group peptidase (beta-lactamase class C family) [Gammaproteobacteria bacterium]|jgi:CubicO group peptidase (beta-lactamase class C family)
MPNAEELYIDGWCAPKFLDVRRAFEENLRDPLEHGEAVCVVIDGETVVDLWGGTRDHERKKPWTADTWACFFSVGKPIAALALAQVMREEKIGLATPVIEVWPEYGAAGKSGTTFDHVLSHLAGIPGAFAATRGTAYEWADMINAIEAQAPLWPVGTQGCYHTFTYGHIVGELAFRLSGKTIGTLVQERIVGPLEIELGFGLDADTQRRCAHVSMTPGDPLLEAIQDPETLIGRCWAALPLGPGEEDFNSSRCRAAQMPSFNGHGTARGLAKLYSSLALAHSEYGPEQPFPGELIREMTQEQWHHVDALGLNNRMARGFRLKNAYAPFNGAPKAFGHSGIGGALAFGDPELRLGFGFITNRLASGPGASPYATRLAEAVRGATV